MSDPEETEKKTFDCGCIMSAEGGVDSLCEEHASMIGDDDDVQ